MGAAATLRRMRSVTVLAALLPALALGACAPVATERAERDAAMLRALEPCQRQFPRVRVLGVDERGAIQVHVWSRSDMSDFRGLQKCAQERLANAPEIRALVSGELAPTAGPSSVPLQSAGSALVVAVAVNGAQATLVLDTGAALTLISPRLAGRAGVTVPAGGSKIVGTVVGGRTVEIPIARVRAFGVGPAVVENLQVGVYDALPNRADVDGLLGANFLDHFKVTIDRQNRRLSLEPSRATSGVPAAGTAGREWRVPVFVVGDRWQVRWQGPAGSGTIGFTVEAEELVDGVAHYVVRSGAYRFYYVKAAVALHFQKEGDAVIMRRVPPGAYDWPLRVGKQWEQNYRHENVRTGRTLDVYRKCIVAGSPTITVPAGTFDTLHIVCLDREDHVMSEVWYSEVTKYPVQQREATTQGAIVTELVAYSVRRAP